MPQESIEKPESQTPPPPPEPAWSLRVATVAGIPIRLHFTFLLLLAWVWIVNKDRWESVIFVLGVFLCVVLHELGHSVVALKYKIPVADITLYPIGGVARIEKRPEARQELWIALAGPAVNVVIAAILWIALKFPVVEWLRQWPPFAIHGGLVGESATANYLGEILIVNIALALFNMVPAFPMDGGRVLRAILGLNMPVERATAIAASVGQFIAIVVGFCAIFSGQWFLMFIAFFVYLGAGQEAFVYRQAALVEGVSVRQAMMTDVHTLSVGNTLKEAADVLLATSQHDFPVLHGDEVQGVLTRNGLLKGLSEAGPAGYVAGAMDRHFVSVGPEDNLTEMLPRLQSQSAPILVLDPSNDNRLIGIVTGDNVAEFFAVRRVVAARDAANSR